jgi:hypothetical protein
VGCQAARGRSPRRLCARRRGVTHRDTAALASSPGAIGAHLHHHAECTLLCALRHAAPRSLPPRLTADPPPATTTCAPCTSHSFRASVTAARSLERSHSPRWSAPCPRPAVRPPELAMARRVDGHGRDPGSRGRHRVAIGETTLRRDVTQALQAAAARRLVGTAREGEPHATSPTKAMPPCLPCLHLLLRAAAALRSAAADLDPRRGAHPRPGVDHGRARPCRRDRRRSRSAGRRA